MTIFRTPYCRKVRYGVTGAPILDEGEMDGTFAPGVGLDPALIEFVYSSARDGRAARVDASVTGWWTRFGKREAINDQMTTHFVDGPDGWPAWLAEEARLHDPAAVSGRADTLRWAADQVAADTGHIRHGSATDYANRHADLLRRLADEEPQQPTDEDVVEAHRLALSFALGLGSGAPWDAIRDRATELHGASEEPQS